MLSNNPVALPLQELTVHALKVKSRRPPNFMSPEVVVLLHAFDAVSCNLILGTDGQDDDFGRFVFSVCHSARDS